MCPIVFTYVNNSLNVLLSEELNIREGPDHVLVNHLTELGVHKELVPGTL